MRLCAHSGQNERSPSTPSVQNDQRVAAASSALTLWSHAVHRTAVGSGGARSRLRFWGKIDVIPLACSIASRLALELAAGAQRCRCPESLSSVPLVRG
jgi:hypothetical protein